MARELNGTLGSRSVCVQAVMVCHSLQGDFYSTHQIFLSGTAVFLAVWNVTQRRDGAAELEKWLRNIHVSTCCVCVGRCAGVLVCWCAGVLVCWCEGVLV